MDTTLATLETGIRERPGPYLIGALAAGYLLQTIPCGALLVLIGTLCLRLIKPVLFWLAPLSWLNT